jgi:uncharacterized membrane protein YdjX (TVP38/TMEM64 family)
LSKPSGAFPTLIGCGLGAILLAATICSRFIGTSDLSQIEELLRSTQSLGASGMVAFILIQILVAMSGVLPASLIGIASGVVYGVSLGFGIATLSTMTGAILAFLLSRSLLRPIIAGLIERRNRLRNFDSMLARDGWRVVFLLRLSPIMPFAVTSYALGISSISFRHYLIGCLASLPSLLGYVFIGSLTTTGLAAISHGSSPLKWALVGLGIVATALVTWRIGKLAALAGFARPLPYMSK